MSRRRSTVHDAGALRLHPSGVRVNNVHNAGSVAVKTKTPTLSRRLPRGDWIATDAGGDGRVIKRRKISEGRITNRETGVFSTADHQGEQLEDIPVKVYKDTRANRRVAFENDHTFLASPSVPEGTASHLQPSSDFLKCIHYFASQYYESRGQLFDSARDYRKEKRWKQMLRAAVSESQAPENSQDEDGNAVEDQKAESGDSSKEATPTSERPQGDKKTKSTKQTQRDMYKAFDGSALLCIGTLLQSHIASSLAESMPDGWENDDLADGSEGSRGGTESDPAEIRFGQENDVKKMRLSELP